MLTPTGGVPYFRGFSIDKVPQQQEGEVFTFRLNGLSKAQFVDPPMEHESLGFTKYFAGHVQQQAGHRAWNLFTRRPRTSIDISSRIEERGFWQRAKELAQDVGAEPMLIVSGC